MNSGQEAHDPYINLRTPEAIAEQAILLDSGLDPERLRALAGEPALRAQVALIELDSIAVDTGDETLRGLVRDVHIFAFKAARLALGEAGYRATETGTMFAAMLQAPENKVE